MILTLDEVKEWLRVDGNDDDLTLTLLINVSEEYLKNATGHIFDDTNKEAKLLCLVFIVDMYEKRTFSGPSEEIRHITKSMIEQLTYCYIKVPTGLNATVEAGVIKLDWVASNEPYLVGYKIYKDTVEIAKTTTNYFEVAFLSGIYRVSVYNRDNNESGLSKGVIL